MSIIVASLLAVCLAEAAYGLIARREGYFAIMFSGATLAFAIGILRGVRLALSSPGGLELIAAASALLLFIQATGRPRQLAQLVGTTPAKSERQFDQRLYDAVDGFSVLLDRHPGTEDADANQRWRRMMLLRGPASIDDIRRLRSPTSDWSALRDLYVTRSELVLRMVREGDDPELDDRLRVLDDELVERRKRLRSAYESRARGRSAG